MFAFPPLTRFVRSALFVLFAAFVVTALVERFLNVRVFPWVALLPEASIAWTWQIVTYPFALPLQPGSLPSLLFTLFFLYLIGAPFEQRFGPRATLSALIIGALSAAVVVMGVSFLAPGLAPLFGASPLVFALFVAFITSVKAGQVSFFGVGPMRAWHAIAISLTFSFLSYVTSGNLTPFIADIGAIAGGYAYGAYLSRPPGKTRSSKSPPKRKPFPVIEGGKSSTPPKWLN